MDGPLNRSGEWFQNTTGSVSRFTGFALDGRKADSCKKKSSKKKSRRSQKWINLGFWETDPKSTSTLTQHLKENVGLGEE